MMWNKECRISLLCGGIISVILIIGAFLYDPVCGLFVLASSVSLSCIYLCVTQYRYRAIARMSEEIDRTLHDVERYSFCQSSEGELAILQNEIVKLTVRLREQAENLKNDKKYLADSMADISHQLRTPLTSINLINNFLMEDHIDEQQRCDLVKEQCMLLNQMEWLINTLLKLSKLDAGTLPFAKEKVPVRDVIKKAYEPIAIAMDLKNQQFRFQCDREISFEGDIHLTAEALENILKNCMEHTPREGSISVVGKENSLYTEIVIEDDGPGISDIDISHIFERFYKGENSAAGSVGIGLHFARMVIVSQNGTVKVRNRKPHGCQFVIHFYKGAI